MEEIIKYKSNDGTIFDRKEDCVNYESICEKVKDIEDSYLPKPSRKIENNEYYEHSMLNVYKAKTKFYNLCSEVFKLTNNITFSKIFDEISCGNRHPSHGDRILSDFGYTVLSNFSYRLRCIGYGGKEYQQPYFVTHENEATIKIN